MIDLSDFTFVIPWRWDSDDRIHNLERVIRFFKMHYENYELILIEDAKERKVPQSIENEKGITYIFRQNDNDVFHKTKILNDGFKLSKRRFVSCYDVDVIPHPNAFSTAKIVFDENPNIKYIFPYNGAFLDLGKGSLDKFEEKVFSGENYPCIKNATVSTQYTVGALTYVCVNANSPGGMTLLRNDESLWSIGAYNENIMACGYEDDEIALRYTKLGHPPHRLTQFNIVHMQHDRGPNCYPHKHANESASEHHKVYKMQPEELRNYVKNGFK
jgi:hypothetical protein